MRWSVIGIAIIFVSATVGCASAGQTTSTAAQVVTSGSVASLSTSPQSTTSTMVAATTTITALTTTTTGLTTTTAAERFTSENYSTLADNPDKHKGATVDIVGHVYRVDRDGSGLYVQMWASPANSERRTIVRYTDPDFQVKQDDYVHVLGVVVGAFHGTNAFGVSVDAPAVLASSLEVVDASAAGPKPLRIAAVNLSQTQHSLTVKITKVEFRATDTRVYVTVKNSGTAKVEFRDYDAKATQGSEQYESDLFSDYPAVSGLILPGVEVSGIILFKAMDSAKETKVYLDANMEDYSLDFKTYVFTIPAG